MGLAVEARHPDIDDRIAERAARLGRLHDALLDGRDVLARDHATDDLVDELDARTALGRLDAQARDRELTVATALLLELPFRFGRSRDRLAVRDLDVFALDLDAELARQLLERDRQVRLAHAAEQRLVGLRVALDAHDRILGLQAVQRVRELVLVGLGLGVDRDGEHRVGEREVGGVDLDTLGREHVAGREVVELGHCGDVARRDLRDGVLLLAAHREQLVHALVGVRAHVHEHVVVLHRPLQHLEEVHVADVRVDDRLEHLHDRRSVARPRAPVLPRRGTSPGDRCR